MKIGPFAYLLAFLISLLMVVSLASLKSSAAQASPAGYWRGSGSALRLVDLKLATVEMSGESQFWFDVDGKGEVHGYGQSTYRLVLDDERLRSLLGWSHRAATDALSILPQLGVLVGQGTSTKDLLGLQIACDEPMPVRTGAITGTLSGKSLHLAWKSQPRGIPYKQFLVYSTSNRLRSENSMAAFGPWSSDASIAEDSLGNYDASVLESSASRREGNLSVSATWTAYRVNGVSR